jgi:hypothetical protein
VWPRSECLSEERCLDLIYQPFAGYEPSFIGQLGADAMGVHTFVPHLPFEETGHPTMQRYLADLEAVNSNYLPSTFSVVGYASGAMFETLMTPCGAAPTRACIHEGMFALRDWSPDGLTGPITPFRTSRATWDSPFGEYDFKWIFNCSTRLRVQDVGGELAWKRSGPAGYECGDINVARSR